MSPGWLLQERAKKRPVQSRDARRVPMMPQDADACAPAAEGDTEAEDLDACLNEGAHARAQSWSCGGEHKAKDLQHSWREAMSQRMQNALRVRAPG